MVVYVFVVDEFLFDFFFEFHQKQESRFFAHALSRFVCNVDGERVPFVENVAYFVFDVFELKDEGFAMRVHFFNEGKNVGVANDGEGLLDFFGNEDGAEFFGFGHFEFDFFDFLQY